MSQIPSLGNGTSASQNAQQTAALKGLDMDHFLKLMIAELQNQDPLNPMENSEMLAQIGQIREIGATDELSKTLTSMRLGQNLNSAAGLIGKTVRALSIDQSVIEGVVDRVSVNNGVPTLHVGQNSIKLENVSEIRGGEDTPEN